MKVAKLILSRHAKSRIEERIGEIDFKMQFDEGLFFRDKFDRMKFYLNFSLDKKLGFLVLQQVSKFTFVVRTVTKRGKIDDRDFIYYDRVVFSDGRL